MSSKNHQLICRTCLKVIKDNELYTNAETRTNCGKVIDVLETCVSELNLDLTNEVLLCCNCFTMLRIAYDFKLKCINAEETVFAYLQRHNLSLSDKVQLSDVITNNNNNGDVDIESGEMSNTYPIRSICSPRNDIFGSSFLHVIPENEGIGHGSIYRQINENSKREFSSNTDLNKVMMKQNECSVITFDNVPLLNKVVDDNYNVRPLIDVDCSMILENSRLSSKKEDYFDTILDSVEEFHNTSRSRKRLHRLFMPLHRFLTTRLGELKNKFINYRIVNILVSVVNK